VLGSAADEVAKGGQQLEKDGGRMSFGVRSDGTDGEARESLKSGFAQYGIRGQLGRPERWLRREIRLGWRIWIGFRPLGLLLGREIEQLAFALLQVSEGGKGRARYAIDCISQHDSALSRFRKLHQERRCILLPLNKLLRDK
jgi:hypothetical protein